MTHTSPEGVQFRLLTTHNIKDILAVQSIVTDALVDKTMLETLSEDEYMYMLEGNGVMIGVFMDGALIGFRGVLEPIIDEEHLGYDLGLLEEDLPNILYQEMSMILPTYRGHGLQQQLAKRIMKHIEGIGHTYTYVCCTVAPTNIPSLKDKFNQGMYAVKLKQTYGENWRYTFAKPFEEDWTFDDSDVKSVQLTPFGDHIRLLNKGWYGVALQNEGDHFTITYKKRIK